MNFYDSHWDEVCNLYYTSLPISFLFIYLSLSSWCWCCFFLSFFIFCFLSMCVRKFETDPITYTLKRMFRVKAFQWAHLIHIKCFLMSYAKEAISLHGYWNDTVIIPYLCIYIYIYMFSWIYQYVMLKRSNDSNKQ